MHHHFIFLPPLDKTQFFLPHCPTLSSPWILSLLPTFTILGQARPCEPLLRPTRPCKAFPISIPIMLLSRAKSTLRSIIMSTISLSRENNLPPTPKRRLPQTRCLLFSSTNPSSIIHLILISNIHLLPPASTNLLTSSLLLPINRFIMPTATTPTHPKDCVLKLVLVLSNVVSHTPF